MFRILSHSKTAIRQNHWKSDLSTCTSKSSKKSNFTSSRRQLLRKAFGTIATTIGIGATVAYCSDDVVPAYSYDWSHHGMFSAFDTAALRRGYEVYRQVCATCHSMQYIKFRHLVGVTHTEEQAKALAASFDIKDGPDDKGQMFERPGKLSDGHPQPYPNPEFARYANGGALPPDMSCLSKARVGGEDYIFSLLTGYTEPPAGIKLREGLHFNPYFPGGAISMAPPLQDEGAEYEDDTEPNIAQMAKDVSTFLAWASEPELNERKHMSMKIQALLFGCILSAAYMKRRMWSIFKTRKITYRPIKKPYKVWKRNENHF